MGNPKRSRIGILSGPDVSFYFFGQNVNTDGTVTQGDRIPVLGRGSGFNRTDNFPRLPVPELGVDGIDEYGSGQHSGMFTLQRFLGLRQLDKNYVPVRTPDGESWREKGPWIVLAIKNSGTHHGKLLGTFFGVEMQSANEGVSSSANMAGGNNFVYTHFLPGDVLLDEENYVEEVPTAAS
jgi:hypothetical protein